MSIKGLFTDAGIAAAIAAKQGQGFEIYADSFGVSNVAGILSPTITPNSGQFYQAPVSSRVQVDGKTVKVICTVPQGVTVSVTQILEVYLYGKDITTNTLYLLAAGQPDVAIQYDPSGTTTLELQLSLVDVNLTAQMVFTNTIAYELAEHKTDPNSHPDIIAAIRKAGILIPAGAYPFTYEGQGFDEYPEFDGVKASVTYHGVTLTAQHRGNELNTVGITFNGTSTLIQVATAFNNAHPHDPITWTAPDSTVLAAGTAVFTSGSYAVDEQDLVYQDIDGIYKQALADGSIKSKYAGVAYLAERIVRSSGFFSITTGFDIGSDLYLSATDAGKLTDISTAVKVGTQINIDYVLIGVGAGSGSNGQIGDGFDAIITDTPGFNAYPTTQDAINTLASGSRILVDKIESVHTEIDTLSKYFYIQFSRPGATGWVKYAGTHQTILVTFGTVPTSGTWRLELGNITSSESVDLAFNAVASVVQAAFLAMTGVPAGSTVTGNYTAGFVFTFGDNSNYPLLSFADPGKNEIQTINFGSVPDNGTFQLRWNGNDSDHIAWNDTPSEVLAQILAITGISSGTLTGSILSGSFTFEFTNTDGKQAQALFTVVSGTNTLTSSGSPVVVTVVETQPGQLPGNNLKTSSTPVIITVQQTISGTPVGPATCLKITESNTIIDGYGLIQNFDNGIDLNNIPQVRVNAQFSSVTHPFINRNDSIPDYDLLSSFGLSKQRVYVVGSPAQPGDFNDLASAVAYCSPGDKLIVSQDQVLTAALVITTDIEIEFVNGASIIVSSVIASPVISLSGAVFTRNMKVVVSASITKLLLFMGSDGHHENLQVYESGSGVVIGSAYVLHTDAVGIYIDGVVGRSGNTITDVLVNNSDNISHRVEIRDGDSGSIVNLNTLSPAPMTSPVRLMDGGQWSMDSAPSAISWGADAHILIPGVPDTSNTIPAGSIALNDGDLAYVNLNPVVKFTGVVHSGQNTVTGVGVTSQLVTGMAITGYGIPSGTTVGTVAASSFTLSQNATADGSGNFIASSAGSLTVVAVASSSFVPQSNSVVVARRSANIAYVGINSSVMILNPGEFKPLQGSGYFTYFSAVAGQNLTAGQQVYLSPGGSPDSGRTANTVYLLDSSVTFQAVRAKYHGTVMKDATTGSPIQLIYNGFVPMTGLTPGETYYADPTTPGGIVIGVPGSGKPVQIGQAISSTALLVNAFSSGNNDSLVSLFTEKDYGAGLVGISSVTLPFNPYNSTSIFPRVDGRLLDDSEWTFVFPNVVQITAGVINDVGQNLVVTYIPSGQSNLAAFSGNCINQGDNLKFKLPFIPTDKSSVWLILDDLWLTQSQWSLLISSTDAYAILNTVIAPGQTVYAIGFTVPSIQPAVTSIVAGAGIDVADDGQGNYTISLSGSVATGGYQVNASEGTPTGVTASGFSPTSAQRQLWFLNASGAVPVTAANQIAPHPTNVIGAELVIFGTSDTNYPIFSDGNGLKLNGPCLLQAGESLVLLWTGSVWRETGSRTI